MFGEWGNPDHDDCDAHRSPRLDAGINFIDTADVYSPVSRRRSSAKHCKGRRDEVVLATKDACRRWGDEPNRSGALAALDHHGGREQPAAPGHDWIDLYQMHRPDPTTDIDETLGALTDLVRQGKIRYIGSSTYPASEHRRGPVGCRDGAAASASSASSRRTRCSCVVIETEICPSASATAWASSRGVRSPEDGSPACSAWAGTYRRRTARRERRTATTHPTRRSRLGSKPSKKLALLAEEAGMSLITMSLAFLLAHPRHVADHRPAHHAAARGSARGRRRNAVMGRARPHR